ncbi:MAG: hypothetical protein P4L87_07125, partial [Formivibrio sp.]|nr:hypothetical protein [Formivibrio sp.]
MRRLLRSPLWLALLLALADWATGFSEPVAHAYWNMVYKNWQRPAPRSIIVVNVDDIANLGAAGEAQLIDLARLSSPRRLYIDTKLQFSLSKIDDAKLRVSLSHLTDNAVFVVRPVDNSEFENSKISIPDPSLVHNNKIVVSNWNDNFLWFVESAPYWVDVDGVRYSTFSSDLSGVHSGLQSLYYPDFSVDPATIPSISARALLDGRTSVTRLAGKVVILASSDRGPALRYFGHGSVVPAAFDIAGAVALSRPINANLSGLALLALAFGALYLGHNAVRKRTKWLFYSLVPIVVLPLPVLLREVGLVAYPDVAMFCVGIFASIRIWQKRIRRVQHTSASGLPNMLALSNSTLPVGCDVVVASVARYEEMLATLPRELHGECARQIARRIAVGCGATEIYHSDGGHFAWTEEARPLDMQLSHLEGLRALFAAPLQIGPHTFDTNIHFGLDRNEGVETATRVNSALASANEALANGRAIELFEAHRLAEAPWELSLHARIDEG